MVVLDIEELIPENQLLCKSVIRFNLILSMTLRPPYDPSNSHLSVDPVSMFKMLLIGYLHSIKSMHRLIQEIQLNIAYL